MVRVQTSPGEMPTSIAFVTTTLSTKGQVVLPKTIREQKHWPTGTRLVVEDTAEGVLLRAAPAFPQSRPEDVFASLAYDGKLKSLTDIQAGIEAEVKQRHASDRY